MNVTIYCRISLDRTGEMLGVERQETECRAFCERQGWNVREVLVDNDISATSGKIRPAFEKLLTSSPEAIVAWHTDRLVRKTRELERIIDLKVNVYALHAGHIDLSTPAGRATAKTITAWAEYEGEQKALRQKSSHVQRAKAGKSWWTRRPFGYQMDGTLHPKESRLVKSAYIDFVSGKATLSEIARYWNASGHPTTSSNQWTQSSVRQVLASARNAGIRTQHGAEIGPGLWTPIISDELYRATLAVLNDPSRKMGGGGRRQGLLVGVAVCGVCGATMRLSTNGKTSTGYRKVYSCTAKQCTSHPATDVDDFIGELMIQTLLSPKVAELLSAEGERPRGDLLTEREALTVAMKELGEDRADGLVDSTEFRRLRKRQMTRMKEIDDEIRHSLRHTSIGGLPDLAYMAENWFEPDRLTTTQRRQAVEALLTIVCLPRQRGARAYDPAVSLQVSRVTGASAADAVEALAAQA